MKYKAIILFLISIIIFIPIKNVSTSRRLATVSSTITLTQLNETSEITFSKNLLIWPENCKLSVKDENGTELANDRDYIFINSSTSNSISLSVSERDSGTTGECRYYYVELSDTINLTHTGMFRFKEYSNLTINFNSEGETNSIYSLYINKLGGDNLTFTIQNGDYSIKFTMTNSDPNRILYMNRNNFLKKCLEQEPYECSVNISVDKDNIPFNIFISNANNNTHSNYLKANEMILGVAQSFTPLYFFTEIPYGSSGEIFVNYKKGGTIVYSQIVNKGNNEIISIHI